jgi:hypothetical protein
VLYSPSDDIISQIDHALRRIVCKEFRDQ